MAVPCTHFGAAGRNGVRTESIRPDWRASGSSWIPRWSCWLERRRGGRGVVLVGPHICSYLLSLTRLNECVPLTVYLRYSKDERRRVAKQRWYDASGVQWISEPASQMGSLGRVGRMAAALTEGRTLFITPDLPQKRGDGTPVRLLGREVYLPAGAATLAVRTGAPLLMLTAERVASRRCGKAACATQRLIVHGPYPRDRDGCGAGTRRAAVSARLQWFADALTGFVTRVPELWYLWGDKRWTRVFSR